MRMKLYLYYLLAAFLTVNIFCSGSEDNIAGGTGTGNPPVITTAIVLIADTSNFSLPLQKTSLDLPVNTDSIFSNIGTPFDSISISDDSNMAFNVESAKLVVSNLYFTISSQFNCSELLNDNFADLRCDSQGIFIEGPFIFDLLNGSCEPSLDSLQLPGVSYSGLKLLIDQTKGIPQGNSPYLTSEQSCPMEISGTFVYNDTVHNFSIQFSGNSLRSYFLKDSTVSLNKESNALFLLKLQSRQWLESVSFQACLDNGNIQFNQTGELIIDANTGSGPCRGVEAKIRDNILNSGRIEILQ